MIYGGAGERRRVDEQLWGDRGNGSIGNNVATAHVAACASLSRQMSACIVTFEYAPWHCTSATAMLSAQSAWSADADTERSCRWTLTV